MFLKYRVPLSFNLCYYSEGQKYGADSLKNSQFFLKKFLEQVDFVFLFRTF